MIPDKETAVKEVDRLAFQSRVAGWCLHLKSYTPGVPFRTPRNQIWSPVSLPAFLWLYSQIAPTQGPRTVLSAVLTFANISEDAFHIY